MSFHQICTSSTRRIGSRLVGLGQKIYKNIVGSGRVGSDRIGSRSRRSQEVRWTGGVAAGGRSGGCAKTIVILPLAEGL